MSLLIHDNTLLIATLTVWPPFVSFLLIMLFTRKRPWISAALSLASATGSLLGASLLMAAHRSMERPIEYTGSWFSSGDIVVPFGFLLDPTSLLMLAVVAAVSFLVQIYSLGYMEGDPGFGRYYGFQSLFAWAMMALTVSSSLLQLYVFWELVGLSSYLLIGFWYERFSATQAGKKAFVMTRLGDVALFVGLLLVLIHFGNVDILHMNGMDIGKVMSSQMVTLCALLIFGGVVGKSAQFPLMTWLPDAMEGPTPVSALLHSATMVAAGVYLFARLFPFFSQSSQAMVVFLFIGTLSMLLASTMAMVDRDIKKVWAYSTISQLGFMIMALGGGGYFAGTFHLTTHAGFKALLFLSAGVWIHAFETNDMFEIAEFGGRSMKIPMVCTILAAASLSGIPPFSGFFSKEAIMSVLAAQPNPIWVAAGLTGVFLTAYYAFRPVFIILCPKRIERTLQAKGPKGHGSADSAGGSAYWLMAVPLIILAVVIAVLGFFERPLMSFLLVETPAEGAAGGILYASMALAVSALFVAWIEFGRRGAAGVGFVERIAPLRALFSHRWYIDHFYRLILEFVVYKTLAGLFTRNDRQVIDGGVDAFCRFTVRGGRVVSYAQAGMLRRNLAVTLAVVGFLALTFFFF
jgi:NADH-quinone oxidoreductase subunit L